MSATPATAFRFTRLHACIVPAFLIAAALVLLFREGLTHLVQVWFTQDEYSHGVLIPLLSAFLLWQNRALLVNACRAAAWSGCAVAIVALTLNLIGKLGSTYALQQYAFVLALVGLLAALRGWRVTRALWAPLAILLLMIPLPNFILNNLSAQLQLISSQIGVAFIKLCGISVFAEGNVIDLGVYRLQVAEACDGLRYLFPLLTLGFIMAYFFSVALWKRIVLFLSAIPLTVLMNSLRIGMIGVMVEHRGVSMAEGFLHEFQGWAVFMVSAALMLCEVILLARIGPARRPWREVFGFHAAPQVVAEPATEAAAARVSRPFVASTVVIAVFALGALFISRPTVLHQTRESFASFPTQLDGWAGRRVAMESIYLDTLKLDDYVLADYLRSGHDPVNLYVAWYDSQIAGQSAHSPRACLPGGGWRITSIRRMSLDQARVGERRVVANRVLMELGGQKQIAYYWFQQRGRVITNEYLVKWYLFWDAVTKHRTDGALVRLVTPLKSGETEAAGDRRLQEFARIATARLDAFVPK